MYGVKIARKAASQRIWPEETLPQIEEGLINPMKLVGFRIILLPGFI